MFRQPNSAATAERKVIYEARSAGTVLDFRAGSIAKALGGATVTIDLLKNGTTMLTTPLVLNSSNVNYTAAAASLASTSFSQNDVLEVNQTVAVGGGTLPTGVYASLTVNTDATP
jgi:hypothetical protein